MKKITFSSLGGKAMHKGSPIRDHRSALLSESGGSTRETGRTKLSGEEEKNRKGGGKGLCSLP